MTGRVPQVSVTLVGEAWLKEAARMPSNGRLSWLE